MMLVKSSEELGKNVKNIREKLRLSQKQLAEISRVDIEFIENLEKGLPTCQLGQTFAVLNFLDIKVDAPELLEREPEYDKVEGFRKITEATSQEEFEAALMKDLEERSREAENSKKYAKEDVKE